MPIYEYQCRACGFRFELMQRISDPPPEACEECGGEVKKLISAPAFQFKGSGWYVTDYARKGEDGKGKSEAKDGKEATAADGKSAKEGDGATKTAPKADAASSTAKQSASDSAA